MADPAKQLYNAFRDEDYDEVNELINRHGGFNKVVDENGWTALHEAAGDGRVPILQNIWKMTKPDIDQKDNNRDTPLHSASYFGNLPSVQWLVGHGSDPQAINIEWNTAKDIAKRRSKTEVEKFLEKIEAMPPDMFPVKQPSPINYFAINNDVKGIEEYFSRESQTANDGTDDANSEVITYVSFIL